MTKSPPNASPNPEPSTANRTRPDSATPSARATDSTTPETPARTARSCGATDTVTDLGALTTTRPGLSPGARESVLSASAAGPATTGRPPGRADIATREAGTAPPSGTGTTGATPPIDTTTADAADGHTGACGTTLPTRSVSERIGVRTGTRDTATDRTPGALARVGGAAQAGGGDSNDTTNARPAPAADPRAAIPNPPRPRATSAVRSNTAPPQDSPTQRRRL